MIMEDVAVVVKAPAVRLRASSISGSGYDRVTSRITSCSVSRNLTYFIVAYSVLYSYCGWIRWLPLSVTLGRAPMER